MILANTFVFRSELVSGGAIYEWDVQSFGLMLLSGLMAFVGVTLNVVGYQIGDATKVASMEYLDLIYAFIFQWFMFGDVPNVYEWIGLACLLSTCFLHLAEEWLNYQTAKKKASFTEDSMLDSGKTEKEVAAV